MSQNTRMCMETALEQRIRHQECHRDWNREYDADAKTTATLRGKTCLVRHTTGARKSAAIERPCPRCTSRHVKPDSSNALCSAACYMCSPMERRMSRPDRWLPCMARGCAYCARRLLIAPFSHLKNDRVRSDPDMESVRAARARVAFGHDM